MLLTSSQVSFLFSTGIIITFTSALFLAGYVLQQQTLHSLQAEIKPRVSRLSKRASAARTTSRVFESPAPLVAHATPVLVRNSHEAPAGWAAAAAATEAPKAGSNVRVAAGAAPQTKWIGGEGGWKSREKMDEEANLNKGQERFEKEGDDFFSPGKANA